MAARTVSIYPSGSSNPAGDDASYTTMTLMETGEDGDLTGGNPLQVNITASDGNWNTADTSVIFTGWTTDGTDGITITALNDGARNMYTDAESGTYSTSRYRMEENGANTIRLHNSARIDVTVEYVQLKNSDNATGYFVIYISDAGASSTLNVHGCWLEHTRVGAAGCHYSVESNITEKLINCILYDSDDDYRVGSVTSAKLVNCTISKAAADALESDGQTSHALNCAVFNNTDDFEDVWTSINYCASDDGDGNNPVDISPGGTEADNWKESFTDYANGDFRITSPETPGTSRLKDASPINYFDDSDVPSVDIAGNPRNVGEGETVSIGAFEYYVAAGVAPTAVLYGPLVGPMGGPI